MSKNELPSHLFLAESLRAARAAASPAELRASIVEVREWAMAIQVCRNAERVAS